MIFTYSLIVFYFLSLLTFCLVTHPVHYCVLLVCNSLLSCLICYRVYGYCWYALLFCLVYVGGVYILFVFVSIHGPNTSMVSHWNWATILARFAFFFFCYGIFFYSCGVSIDLREFICNIREGWFYLCLCLTLLYGFIVLSIVRSIKINHYR